MTHHTAIRKLNHAIDYLMLRAGKMPPLAIRDGAELCNPQTSDHNAVTILARAECCMVAAHLGHDIPTWPMPVCGVMQ